MISMFCKMIPMFVVNTTVISFFFILLLLRYDISLSISVSHILILEFEKRSLICPLVVNCVFAVLQSIVSGKRFFLLYDFIIV